MLKLNPGLLNCSAVLFVTAPYVPPPAALPVLVPLAPIPTIPAPVIVELLSPAPLPAELTVPVMPPEFPVTVPKCMNGCIMRTTELFLRRDSWLFAYLH